MTQLLRERAESCT